LNDYKDDVTKCAFKFEKLRFTFNDITGAYLEQEISFGDNSARFSSWLLISPLIIPKFIFIFDYSRFFVNTSDSLTLANSIPRPP